MKTRARLGQHFLKDKKILSSIIAAADLQKNDRVLEIGPGKGVLTNELLKHVEHVTAIEKDSALVETLSERFKDDIVAKKLELIKGDVRNIDLNKLSFSKQPFKLIANIPYYITGELLKTFLGGKIKPERIVFLMQKEVAERILGKSTRGDKESILSLSVKAYGAPHYIRTVSKKSFSPEPSVSSAVLAIEDISDKRLSGVAEKTFFEVVKTGFAQKRKFLKSNLKTLEQTDVLEEVLNELNIPNKARAEDVSFEDWVELTRHLQKRRDS